MSKSIILVAALLLLSSSLTLTSGRLICNTVIRNRLSSGSIMLCAQKDAGKPGSRFSHSLAPGDSYTYPCPMNAPNSSYEVYFSYRDDKECSWDNCPTYNTGTCKSYPWILGEGVSWKDGNWYGFVGANFDGGTGYIYPYRASNVSYGVQAKCKTAIGACFVDTQNDPACSPAHLNFKKPGTGVMACGPSDNEGSIYVDIFES